MASPEPPVALKNQCSVIHNGVLYVYSPDAFQSLPLNKNATWTQQQNGVSVTGAVCVKGGTEGDSTNVSLYVVGGTANSSTPNYSGLQRYNFQQQKWQTITPMSTVTANRLNHGATYLNASSAILVYGGSQTGAAGLSTETFLMLMYAPYRVQAYSSIAPAVSKPFVLPLTVDKAVMVGGNPSNQKVFSFHPDPGWVDLGVTLPSPLPDASVAQCNIQTLEDGTKILQTYRTDQSPNLVTRNVLLNPGFIPAPYGTTIGNPTGSGSNKARRQLFQSNYPAYNSTNAPTTQRTNFALASDNGLVALVGGDVNSSVALFNSSGNSWVNNKAFFGATQNVLTVSTSTSSSSSLSTSAPTSTPSLAATPTALPSETAVASSSDKGQSNGLAILGGVLGGICGLAAILIIFLLWLRSRKRRNAAAAAARNQNGDSSYRNDKLAVGYQPQGGSQPLSKQAQPMGRSPVPSTVVSETDSVAIFGGKAGAEKNAEVKFQTPTYGSKLNPAHGNSNSVTGLFKNNKGTLNISKPMLPDLGDYKERPSIDLGNVTPSSGPVPALPPVALVTQQKSEQRKTDEGWAKYFTADSTQDEQPIQAAKRDTYNSEVTSFSRPSTSKGGGGGFWPGSGVTSPSSRSAKLPARDSAGNVLNHYTVAAASPSLEGPTNAFTHNMSVAKPAQAKFSSADSVTTDHSSDDGYEDEEIDNFSDYRGSKLEDNTWTPVDNANAWPSTGRHSFRPQSVQVDASDFIRRPEPSQKHGNAFSHAGPSIPAFPMPNSVSRRDFEATPRQPQPYQQQQPQQPLPSASPSQHPTVTHFATTVGGHSRKPSSNPFNGGPPVPDYFGPTATATSSRATSGKLPDSTDMSWLNLGTPAHMKENLPVGGAHDPA